MLAEPKLPENNERDAVTARTTKAASVATTAPTHFAATNSDEQHGESQFGNVAFGAAREPESVRAEVPPRWANRHFRSVRWQQWIAIIQYNLTTIIKYTLIRLVQS